MITDEMAVRRAGSLTAWARKTQATQAKMMKEIWGRWPELAEPDVKYILALSMSSLSLNRPTHTKQEVVS